MKVYRTGFFAKNLIQEMEAEKWTDKTLTINGTRSNWESRYDRFFKSFDEAKEYIKNQSESNILNLERKLKEENETLIKINQL